MDICFAVSNIFPLLRMNITLDLSLILRLKVICVGNKSIIYVLFQVTYTYFDDVWVTLSQG